MPNIKENDHCALGCLLYMYYNVSYHRYLQFSGLAMLITGIIVLGDVQELKHFIESKAIGPPIVLIVTGLIIFLIASLGCFGAIRESPIMLVIYAALLGVLIVVELSTGIAASVYKGDMEMVLNEKLRSSIQRSNKADTIAWNQVQQSLMCCGVESPADWRAISPNKTLPASCCRPEFIDPAVKHCTESAALGRDKYYQDGCVGKMKERISKSSSIILGVGIGIALLQLLGLILAIYLAKRIRQEQAE